MRRSLVLVALVTLVATACASGEPTAPLTPQSRSTSTSRAPSENEALSTATAPDFTVTTFSGENFSLAEQRGTPVVLNFWESW